MRRGWPLLLLVLALAPPPAHTGPRAAPRAAPGPAFSMDALELLAQIADAPEDDGKLTCFTCSNVTNNDHCNRYAIDRPCEPGLSMCRTDHVIERLPTLSGAPSGAPSTRPRSIRITKTCVAASQCSRQAVGCRGVAGDSTYLRVCTSCCDWSYCNELAPADSQTAVLAVSRSRADFAQPLPSAFFTVFSLAVVLAVF